VEPLELDTAINELETRVERLRSLYEQFFMGIEKIAPAVAHKDVTRRIELLRREQIRNTAKRFRLQMIIQRHNTFQQYWQRILREIENGTYKRHVLRAERSAIAKNASSIPGPQLTDVTAMHDALIDGEPLTASRVRKSILPSAPRHSVPASPRQSSLPPPDKVEAFTRALERDLAAALDGDLDFGSSKRAEFDEQSLELDDPPLRPLKPLPVKSLGKPEPTQAQTPNAAEAPRSAMPLGRLRLPAQSAVGGHGLPPAPPKAAAAAPINRIVTGHSPSASAAQPKAAPAPTTSAAQPKAAPAATTGLSPDRVRELHRDLMQAKAKTNDTGIVSINSLTRKLEATSKQLSEKHAGKKIDFTVVIKDGKAIVKPVVK
jgi:hypothetical protein